MLPNQRPIADVHVEWVSSESVKAVEDTTFKEVYSQILAKPEVTVTLQPDLAAVALNTAKTSSGGDDTEAKTPKHVMQSSPYTSAYPLTLLDRVMICTPVAPFFEVYPTRVSITSDDKVEEARAYTNSGSISVMPKAKFSSASKASDSNWKINTWDTPYKNLFHNEGSIITKVIGSDNFVDVNAQIVSKNWLNINQPFAIGFEHIGSFSDSQQDYLDSLLTEGIKLDDPSFISNLTGKLGAVAAIISIYNSKGMAGLSKADKQAACENYGIDPADPEADKKLEAKFKETQNAGNKTPQQINSAQNSSAKPKTPAIDITWGQLVLTVYQDHTLRLTSGGKQVGPVQTISDYESLMIYPLGNSVYVIPSLDGTEAFKNAVNFNFSSPVVVPESPITVTFRCGAAHFKFSPVIHPYSGEMVSPPMSINQAPNNIVVNIHYVGKFGVGTRGSGKITFPDMNDKTKVYKYLKDCSIEYSTRSIGGNSYMYSIKLVPSAPGTLGQKKDAFLGSAIGSIYSPAVYMSQIFFLNAMTSVGYNPNPQIDNCDLLSVTVNQSVESQSATIVLNNRKDVTGCTAPIGGKYTHKEGRDSFTGIKPIKVELGYNGHMYRVFTGYVTNYKYARSGPMSSTVTLECEDRSKKLKEQYAVNLPFFDGWCHLAVMYYLARYAGFSDSEIYLYQNPESGSGARIGEMLTGSKAIMQGGCFEGHINDGLAAQSAGMSNDYLHMRLPMALMMAKESPNYAFQMGTPIWNCMQEIRSFSGWYLYVNNWGNLVYGPPKLNVMSSSTVFKEVADCNSFNEITRDINVEYNTNDTRNYVFLQGLTWLGNRAGEPGEGQWVPHISVGAKSNWPNDQNEFSHAPWRRAAFMRNPKWEDVRLLQSAAVEMLRRSTRVRGIENFGSWGHPELFPYQIISVDESRDELGVNGMKVVIAAHQLSINASDLMLTSQLSCETFDQSSVDYDPNLPPNKRE